jgi:hypothetical protein
VLGVWGLRSMKRFYIAVEWSRTSHGGKQFLLLEVLEDSTSCSSAYGLCE